MEYTPLVFCKRSKPHKASSSLSDQEVRFSLLLISQNSLQAPIGNLDLSTCLWMVCSGKSMGNSIFKHHLGKLIITKMSATVTDNCSGSSESGKKSFQKSYYNPSIIGGERFRFTHFESTEMSTGGNRRGKP
ncbi:hypothetical protein Tco_1144063 [Tanacetum coccineum]